MALVQVVRMLLMTWFVLARPVPPVTVAYVDYPPFVMESRDAKHPTGVMVDYWEKVLAPAAGVHVEWVGPLSYPRAQKMALEGAVDAIYLIPLSVAEKESLLYSKKIRFSTKQGLLVLKAEPKDKITSVKELKGKNIGKFGGGHRPLFFNSPAVHIEDIVSDEALSRGIQMLFYRRLWGLYLASSEAGFYAAAKMGKLNEVKVMSFPGSEEEVVTTLGFSPKLKSQTAAKLIEAGEKSDATGFLQKGLARAIREASPSSAVTTGR